LGLGRRWPPIAMIRILDEEGHPVVGELLTTLRCVTRQVDRDAFRRAMKRLGCYLGYELARDLPRTTRRVTTPLGSREEPVLDCQPVLATVLRAGLPLWDGMLEALPDADTLVLGAARKEGALDKETGRMEIDISYQSKASTDGRPLVYVDPMLATGSTLMELHPRVIATTGTPSQVIIAGAIAYRPTLERLSQALGASVIVASADDELTDQGYIVPGLGDAGDLAFGGA